MSLLSIPNNFSPLTTIQSALVDANFSAVATAVNNIDNTNIGAAGLYATNLIPVSTATATFGGAFGYKFYPASTGQVPLTVSGVAAQTADLFDVTLTSGGTKAFAIAATGGATFSGSATILGPILITGTSGGGSSATFVSGNTGNSMLFNVPTGQSYSFAVNGVGVASIGATGLGTFSGLTAGTGTVKGASDGATNTYLLPFYTAAGAAVASTGHAVFGSAVFSGVNNVAVTLSGAAVFASSTSYQVYCSFTTVNATHEVIIAPSYGSGSAFTLTTADCANGTAPTITATVYWVAIGT